MINPNEANKLRYETLQNNIKFIENYLDDELRKAIGQGKSIIKISLCSMRIGLCLRTGEWLDDNEALNQVIKNLNNSGWYTKLCITNSDPFFNGFDFSTTKEECLFISKTPIQIKEHKRSWFEKIFGF